MFDVSMQFLKQLFNCIPVFICLYLIFDLIGALLFDKR